MQSPHQSEEEPCHPFRSQATYTIEEDGVLIKALKQEGPGGQTQGELNHLLGITLADKSIDYPLDKAASEKNNDQFAKTIGKWPFFVLPPTYRKDTDAKTDRAPAYWAKLAMACR